jgi:hypothetical protein
LKNALEVSLKELEGKIVRVVNSGLAYIENKDDNASFVFTFDKIPGYRGEYPKELKQFSTRGLCNGVNVRFTIDDNTKITSVSPA